nr:ubiquitin carboxyl-terminal hydrolase CYLD isoform X1 [Helicoverpa armigera]XP_049708185.1 ubiquitin carboxyl-terminal hydrolase CYLD isoform X2 [Helicoverpa armigera]XP_049708186.1 ubiquitin carboxyl-terminal hydrolase CYLD isoform X3 [Helicoverpa armigera]XP_049708187.1 ubiquitin carboxyl-terminal hydrolase CYLD isoform X4 [Helicoverpa armigera]XP_049708188.1 ubiquitin carboxyl-terminal hydrolase CYLD isoform X5 [Helicoverpa armigera]XP_049708190.1 ubiquitin carboxyl-terminal hydrolase CY
MNKETSDISTENDNNSSTRDTQTQQVDLFNLIGGSWPPAPREPERTEYGFSQQSHKHTMQRPSQSERIKSVNLLAHLAPERRRHKTNTNIPSSTVSEDPQPKMVHEPKKIETGILVDICNSEPVPEELYDSPALGSPRVAPPAKPSPVHEPEDIGVGSLVEVATDVDQHYYGVVRWIGVIDDTATAGVELEQSVCGLGDGSRGGTRLFSCAAGRALFVPLPLCRRDARFRDTPPPGRSDPHDADLSDQPDCPIVVGVVPPLSSLGELAGKNRGIQGHHNSCYLDATLFAMFTFTSVFDALLYRPPEPEDSPHYSEVQRVLREEIVNPLRKHGYVRADRVMKLRTLLERLSDVPGLTSEEKDPEEFLNGLVAQLLRAEPFLKLSSGQEAYCYQLFVEKDEHVSLPTVQQLLEQSFTTSGVKLSEVPAAFIIQMPRFGKQYKLYQRVLPSPLLDVTDLIDGLPRQCTVCGSLARWECAACAGAALEAGALCDNCRRVAHATRPHHKATPLNVCEEFANILESCPVPRVYMELFAVLCIETSHYVAFVKAGVGHDAPWCFFDSMADRKGERNGYNIPEIVCTAELGAWLGEEGARAPALPAHAKRLLSDAYMCFYRSPDVAMYR